MTAELEVIRAGPLTTVQDGGRFGHRASGVGPSGAADLGALARANVLVGNPGTAAVLEATFGGLSLRARGDVRVAVTGASCPGAHLDTAIDLPSGAELSLDGARAGIRAYIAVSGGVDVPPVLGSRSTDTLSGIGPPPLAPGMRLPVGCLAGPAPTLAGPEVPPLPTVLVDLDLTAGPRAEWLSAMAWETLEERSWEVSPDSNRVAARLNGRPLRVRRGSLPPEPLVRGAVQLPPDGRPILFLADHPVTGGYPVVGVLTAASCDLLAQCRPGTLVRLSAHLHDDRAAVAGR